MFGVIQFVVKVILSGVHGTHSKKGYRQHILKNFACPLNIAEDEIEKPTCIYIYSFPIKKKDIGRQRVLTILLFAAYPQYDVHYILFLIGTHTAIRIHKYTWLCMDEYIRAPAKRLRDVIVWKGDSGVGG